MSATNRGKVTRAVNGEAGQGWHAHPISTRASATRVVHLVPPQPKPADYLEAEIACGDGTLWSWHVARITVGGQPPRTPIAWGLVDKPTDARDEANAALSEALAELAPQEALAG